VSSRNCENGKVTEARSRTLPLFYVALALYTGLAVFVLLHGVGAAVAASSESFHDQLHEWGLRTDWVGRLSLAMADASHDSESGAQLALDYGFSLFNLLLAGFLVWLRADDATARRLAVAMVGTAAVFNLQAHSVYEQMQVTRSDTLLHDGFQLIAAISYIYALLRFPDGELVPRWPRWAQRLLYVPLTAAVGLLAFQVENTSRTVALILYFGVLTPK
jgi:hypothetical protein